MPQTKKNDVMMLDRLNQIESPQENWRPPIFHPEQTIKDRLLAALRRFLDLQAASIWNDLSRLLPRCKGEVLDVGCGGQPYRQLFPTQVHYQAIDHAFAANAFGYSLPDTTYYDGDRWPINQNSMDIILCTETLEHVIEPGVFLTEAYRCLKPAGHLLLTVPFAARWHYIPWDYWRFTPSGLESLLLRYGFDNIAVYARGNRLTVASYKVLALFLPLLFPQSHQPLRKLLSVIAGLLALPLVIVVAAIGQFSLRFDGGNDCLGYTVVATARTEPLSS